MNLKLLSEEVLSTSNIFDEKLFGSVTNSYKDIQEWIINYENFKKFCESRNLELLKLYYFYKENIHQILYDIQENIELNTNNEIKTLSFYFYLSLLIKEKSYIINYSYSFELINNLYSNIQKETEIYKKIILSKIILELIENYKQLDEYDEFENEITNIENENNKIIENNIDNFNKVFNIKWKEEDIKLKKIDEIYFEIIKSLIENNKFKNYEYTYNIITKLDLESIDITKTMLDGIIDLIKNNENIYNKYIILKDEDLFDNIKINFYYILLKYILNKSIFIYQIDFLMKTRGIIIKLIKSNINEILSNKKIDNNIKVRLDYIIEIIVDSKYYIQLKNKKLKNDTDNGDKKLNNNMNLKGPNKDNLNQKKSKDKKDNGSKELNKNNPKIQEKSTNIKEENNKKVEDESNNPNINENNENVKPPSVINSKRTFTTSNQVSNNEKENINKVNYEIMKYVEIIGSCQNQNSIKKVNTADFITQIDNYFVGGGKSEKLFIFNDTFEKEREINAKWIYNIFYLPKSNDFKKMAICCTKNSIISFQIDNKKENIIRKEAEKNNFILYSNNEIFCCKENGLKSYTDIESKIIKSSDKEINFFKNKLIKSGIKVNNTIIFKSNKIVSNGEDKLFFLDINSNQIFTTNINKEYSFIYFANGLTLIPKKEKMPKNRILLCACKKYLRFQKNGILLLNFKDDNYIDNLSSPIDPFYCTNNFEVFCFCPISIPKNVQILNKKSEKYDTDYFYAGGFDLIKQRGIIKLYKVIYGDDQIKIEFINDIILYDEKKKVKTFRMAISCITQSSIDGKILVSCWDGNIYLFDSPDINYYINYDKQVDTKITFNDFFSYNNQKL